MNITTKTLLWVLAVTHSHNAWASDACSTRAVSTAADVTVSDGTSFKTKSFYQSKDAAAITHIIDSEQTISVEGPLSWTRAGEASSVGEDFHKMFALGHQYHAFMLHFEDIVTDPRPVERISFHGAQHSAVSGDYPYGGSVHLIHSDDRERPAGLLFNLPENTRISAVFSDWRPLEDVMLPYHVKIDDGENVFDYQYSEIEIAPKSPLWFMDAVPAPGLDQLRIYRLHRKLLAAHCLGDADLIAALSAEEILDVSGGELQRFSNGELHSMFESLFELLNYTEYHDIAMPHIEVSKSADLAWIGVNTQPVAFNKESGNSFSDQWAWVMLVKKIDGRWLHVGTSSSRVL